jgi:hypothetical protein
MQKSLPRKSQKPINSTQYISVWILFHKHLDLCLRFLCTWCIVIIREITFTLYALLRNKVSQKYHM